MTVLGAGLLWFGWFGFNAGSALTAGGLAASAFTVTNIAAAAATITWVLASYAHTRKVSVVGAACGAVAGLVAITPASGFVTPGGALIIGLVAGGLCYSATLLRARSKVDDALDVFAVHGVGGMFGAIATGIFASTTVQAAYSGPARRQPAAGRHPGRRRRRHDPVRRRRHGRHRQGRRPPARHPGQARGRGDGPRPARSTARSPIRSDGRAPPGPTSQTHPPAAVDSSSTAAGSSLSGASPVSTIPGDPGTAAPPPRCTRRASSTTPVASGSSRTRADGRATGSCRWPSPGWPRSAIAARSAPTASRATGPGVALPLDRSLLDCWPATPRPDRPGIVSLFLPRGRAPERRARALVEATFAEAGLPIVALARRPGRRCRARAPRRPPRGRPSPRRSWRARRVATDDPRPISDDAFERRLVVARRRLETAARAAGGALAELSVPSASARTIVYKGLVTGGRLPELYPDLRAPLSRRLRGLPPALRDEHAPGLAARPAVPLDRPQRRDQHGPRQPRAGPRPGRRRRARARSPRALLAAGPLLSADGSDSLSLDEALELLTTTGWALTPALLAAIPEALGAAPRAAPARRHARAAGPPASSRRGTGRRPSSSPTAGGSARWSIATGCARRPSR